MNCVGAVTLLASPDTATGASPWHGLVSLIRSSSGCRIHHPARAGLRVKRTRLTNTAHCPIVPRGADHAELGGGDGQDRGAQKAAAVTVDRIYSGISLGSTGRTSGQRQGA